MKNQIIILFLLFALILVSVDGQRRRNRGRGRGRKGPNCHMKEIDKCMEKMEALGKRPQASNIMTTAEGITELCT